jgi:invasion protein IalB
LEFKVEEASVKKGSFIVSAALVVFTPCITGGADVSAQAAKTEVAKSTRQIVGDWVVACTDTDGGHKSCVMSQTLSSGKLKTPVSVLLIGKDRTGKLKGSLRMPVGVSLPPGVDIVIEKQGRFTVPYAACHRFGCFAPFELNASLLGKLKTATKITAIAHSVSQRALNFNFSGRGFAGAYGAYLAQSK